MGSLLRRATHSMARTGPVTSLGQCKAYMHIQMRSRHFWSEYMRRYSPQLKWRQVERSAWSPMIQGAIRWRLTRRPWASIPLVASLCICAAVVLPFRLVFRHFHDQRPGTRPPSFSDSVCQMYRSSAGMAWWMPSKAGERRTSLTVHWLPGMTCVQIIRIGDWFQDFELNKG